MEADMEPAVTVSGLVVERGRREVLHRVSFDVPPGQVAGLLGPSGGGKTTLMRALVGVQQVRSGEVTVLGEELWDQFHGLARAGTTIIVSSHVMDEASRCDRLLLLREGELIADCSPAQLRAQSGTDDMDESFLRIVRARQEVAA